MLTDDKRRYFSQNGRTFHKKCCSFMRSLTRDYQVLKVKDIRFSDKGIRFQWYFVTFKYCVKGSDGI